MASVALVPADPKHYVWWFPGSPVKVHLDLQLVKRLRDRLHSIGTGAVEEGLLFGRTCEGAAEILDFQPASNGNVTGMVASLPKQHGQRLLMGYYRTEEGETFHLTPKDISLAEECFPKPHQVFLMIHSNGFGSPNATFFFHEGDRKLTDFAFLEFPLDPSLLAIEERGRMQRSHQATVSMADPSPAPPALPALEAPRKPRRLRIGKIIAWAWAIGLVFGLGTLVNNAAFQTRFANLRRAISNPPPVSSASPPILQTSSSPLISLHAKRQNEDLELTWNRESGVIAAATSGVITIQDGKDKREIPLDSAQVRSGSLLYSPTSDQVLMQLSVTTATNIVTESVTVVIPKNGSSRVYPLSSSQPSFAAPADAPAQKVEQARATKPFVEPPAPRTAMPPAPILSDAPPSSPSFHPTTTGTPGILAQVPPPLPPPAIKTPEPASATPSQQLPSKIVSYQPAVVISKAAPSFPSELGSLAVQKKVIEITVSIDKNGRVSKAEAVPQKNVNQFFINSALNAARLWKFRPAMRGDEPVASEMVLQFIFGN